VHRRRTAALLVLAVATLAAFALLAAAVTHGWGIVDVDRRVAERVATDMPTWAEWAARPFSWLGGWIGITAVSIAAVGSLLLARRAADAVWLAATVTGIQVLTAVTKAGYDRPRPDAGSPIPLPSSSAFPSGHASGAVVTFCAVAFLLLERRAERRLLVWIGVLGLCLGVGASRVALNVHYLSDVVAGWCLGAAFLALAVLLRDALRSWRATL